MNILSKTTIAASLMLYLGTMAHAADETKYAFMTEFSNKVVYVDSLGLPGNMSLETFLYNMPELLLRPGENLNSVYEVWVNGMAVGGIYEEVLEHLQLADVEKIELTEMSRATHDRMGGTGGLNIILRSKPSPSKSGESTERSWWGNASLRAGYTTHIDPHFQINYNSEKFSIKGITFGEYENRNYESSVTSPTSLSTSDNHNRGAKNFTGIYASWQATARDHFDFKAIGSYSYAGTDVTTRNMSYGQMPYGTVVNDTAHNTSLRFQGCYTHNFSKRARLDYVALLIHGINREYQLDDTYLYSQKGTYNEFSGTINATFRLMQKDNGEYGDLKIGSDYNLSEDDNDYAYNNVVGTLTYDAVGHATSIMPFVRWEWTYRKFMLQAQMDWQIFQYKVWVDDADKHTYTHNKPTWHLAMEQQLAANHHLRLYYERRLRHPRLEHAYPLEFYFPAEKTVWCGNPDIRPTTCDIVNLDYIIRFNSGAHHFTIDLGPSYQRQSEVVNYTSVAVDGTPYGAIGTINKTMYTNNEDADILACNLLVFYRYNRFSCTFGGHYYHKGVKNTITENKTYTNYANFSLMPAFTAPSGWNGSVYIAYFTKVKTGNVYQGDLACTQFKMGKTIGRWDPYFFIKTCFTGNVTDTISNSEGDTNTVYQLLPTTVGVGVRYNF